MSATIAGTGTASGRPRRVAIIGTFDVQNYGDLLFPLIAAHRLAPRGIELVAVSPTAMATGWADAVQPRALGEVFAGSQAHDGVLIGGGNIVHVGKAGIRDYRQGDLFDWAYAGLWFGATLFGAMRNIPVAWNAPGVPAALPEPLRRDVLLQHTIEAADYVSVRDAASLGNLTGGGTDAAAIVVPDTAAELARLWPRAGLAADFATLLERKGLAAPARHVSIHVKQRSMDTPVESLAAAITAFCQAHGLMPALLAIGPVHDDDSTARRIGRHLRMPHLLVDDARGLREIAAVIAHAALHLGSSLHGYITSAAYDVPSALVARPALPKFAGFAAHIGREADVVATWAEAYGRGAALLAEPPRPRIPSEVFASLDRHWDSVGAAFAKPDRGKVQMRARFLRSLIRRGVGLRGLGWAMAPVTT